MGLSIDETPHESDDNQQWLLTDDLPCLGDGYNLRGLVGPIVKCPECGRLNDLRDPSPWQKQDLPLGVRQREHWPASAALFFLLVPVAVFLAWALAFSFGVRGLIVGAVLCLVSLAVWGNQCRKFIVSARSRKWAFIIISGTHLAPGFTLAGILGLILILENLGSPLPTTSLGVASMMAGCLPIGLLLFVWLKFHLKEHDNAAAFRVDWKSYRVPVGEVPVNQ